MNTNMNKAPNRKALLFLGLFMGFGYGMTPSSAWALTINDVVVDLACPCQCPLVLQDCNMSCGLSWKSQVGELINKGMSKQEIIDYFVGKYGEAARITPLQRIQGKIYQYTRGFSKVDLAVLWSGIAVWIILMLFGVFIGVKKTFFNNPQAPEGSL